MKNKRVIWIGGIIGGIIGFMLTFTYFSWLFAGLSSFVYIPLLKLFGQSQFEPLLWWLSSIIIPIIVGIFVGSFIGRLIVKRRK